jgi:hypothetical protein
MVLIEWCAVWGLPSLLPSNSISRCLCSSTTTFVGHHWTSQPQELGGTYSMCCWLDDQPAPACVCSAPPVRQASKQCPDFLLVSDKQPQAARRTGARSLLLFLLVWWLYGALPDATNTGASVFLSWYCWWYLNNEAANYVAVVQQPLDFYSCFSRRTNPAKKQ